MFYTYLTVYDHNSWYYNDTLMFEIMVYFEALIVQSLTFMSKLNSQLLTQNNDSLGTI